jgi:hypothetical protein
MVLGDIIPYHEDKCNIFYKIFYGKAHQFPLKAQCQYMTNQKKICADKKRPERGSGLFEVCFALYIIVMMI